MTDTTYIRCRSCNAITVAGIVGQCPICNSRYVTLADIADVEREA